MNISFLSILFGVLTVYFGIRILQIIPVFIWLLIALFTRRVNWPGPRIHDTHQNARVVRARLGTGYQYLFSTFIWNTLSATGTFVYFLLMFIVNSTSWLNGYVVVRSTWIIYLVTLVVFFGGRYAVKEGQRNRHRVKKILSTLANNEEPPAGDSQSAKSEYTIEHPLIMRKDLTPESRRAFSIYYESVRCHQDGNGARALVLYQEATRLEPSLHENACEFLSEMVVDCSLKERGAICYWLGIHSENLFNWRQAASWYEEAAKAYDKIGYKKRESRVHNNLGNVKMQMRDPAAMEEFEKAVALNPENGTAYLNIAKIYYRISESGDYRFELALNAFADAIVADPLTYGPEVISSLREIGYTWKEDLEEITKRVERKQRAE